VTGDTGRDRVRSLLAGLRARAASWWAIVAILPMAGAVTVATGLLLSLVLGLLPLVFIVGMSVLLGRLPGVLTHPHSGSGWSVVGPALAVATGAFALQQVLGPLRTAVGESIARRVDGAAVDRMMSVALERATVRDLDDLETLQLLHEAREALLRQSLTPGEAAAGLVALVARYTQLVGACGLLGYALGPAAGVLAGLTALVVRFGQRGSLGRFADLWSGLRPQRRALAYVRRIGAGAEAAKEIRVLGLAPWIGARHDREAGEFLELLWAGRRRLLFRPFVVLALVGLLGLLAVLLTLADVVVHGRPTLLQFAIAVQSVLIPARFGVYFPECDVQTQYGMSAMNALTAFEKRVGAHAPSSAEVAGTAVGGLTRPTVSIRFEGVGFRYHDDGPWVLRGIDLELRAGRSTAVVGLNGAGKTTLVKLLTGLYRPTEGRITVDGRDLADLPTGAWHAHLAVLLQDFIRYELSFDENVMMGTAQEPGPDVDLSAVLARAGAAEVRAVLPAGGATVLSSRYDGGTDLSGGQWQRVALARMFRAVEDGASVLVLDEPTAALDVRAEADFFDRVFDLRGGLTGVVISHRFATVRRADRIVVLEHGRVLEEGTHESLLAAEGRYAELFTLQAQRFEPAGRAPAAEGNES
jgi:ATP-binding cassette, subfamily B, bacterial